MSGYPVVQWYLDLVQTPGFPKRSKAGAGKEGSWGEKSIKKNC